MPGHEATTRRFVESCGRCPTTKDESLTPPVFRAREPCPTTEDESLTPPVCRAREPCPTTEDKSLTLPVCRAREPCPTTEEESLTPPVCRANRLGSTVEDGASPGGSREAVGSLSLVWKEIETRREQGYSLVVLHGRGQKT